MEEVENEYNYDGDDMIVVIKAKARMIVEKAKSYSVASRSIHVTNDKLLQKTEKLKLATRSNTGMFAQMLLLIRRKLKHRGLQLIQPTSPDWLNLKESCKLATEFCNEFEYERKEGYKVYIETGLTMMKNFSIYKFKNIHGAICNRVEALQEIKKDRTPEDTRKAHDAYLSIISEKVGYAQDYKDNPEKYKFFIEAKNEAAKLGVSARQYIQAQFSAFEWKSGIPDPMQLVGPKARERVQKWAFENNITLGSKSNQGIKFDLIRGKKSKHNR